MGSRGHRKVKGARLLPHEQALLDSGALADATHARSSSIWLARDSAAAGAGMTTVYRHMGDPECLHLLAHGQLPDSQPYQTIVEGPRGRVYAEKYLRGRKKVDSSPTTVVEFVAPKPLIAALFEQQSKTEDGVISAHVW